MAPYAGLLKKHGLVANADSSRFTAGKRWSQGRLSAIQHLALARR
jgi:hypothetical protein